MKADRTSRLLSRSDLEQRDPLAVGRQEEFCPFGRAAFKPNQQPEKKKKGEEKGLRCPQKLQMGLSYLHGQEGDFFSREGESKRVSRNVIPPSQRRFWQNMEKMNLRDTLGFWGRFLSLAKKRIRLRGKRDPTPFTTITDNLRCTCYLLRTSFLFPNPF